MFFNTCRLRATNSCLTRIRTCWCSSITQDERLPYSSKHTFFGCVMHPNIFLHSWRFSLYYLIPAHIITVLIRFCIDGLIIIWSYVGLIRIAPHVSLNLMCQFDCSLYSPSCHFCLSQIKIPFSSFSIFGRIRLYPNVGKSNKYGSRPQSTFFWKR